MRKKISVILLILLMLLSTACSKTPEEETPVDPEPEKQEEVVDPEPEKEVPYENTLDYKELNYQYNTMKSSYGDYVGEIFFESDLVNLPFVQGASNDTYLRTDFQTGQYDSSGSIFMDYRNTLDDQNIIIYGHYVYLSKDPSGEKKFTPLRFLTEEENYEANKYFYLLLDGELRKYEIASVYYCQLSDAKGYWETDPDMQYYITNYSEGYFNAYKEKIKEVEFYDTGVDFNYEDKFVTLQTCVENREDLREIVLGKLVRVVDTNRRR